MFSFSASGTFWLFVIRELLFVIRWAAQRAVPPKAVLLGLLEIELLIC